MKKTLVWTILLAGTWWLWSAHTELLIIIFGILSLAITLLFFSRMDRDAADVPPYTLGLRPLFYLPYLTIEIIKANIDVAKIVLSPKMKISPRMFKARASQKTIVGQVVYANSITLTPGTITLDVRDGEFLIHALTNEAAEGVLAGDMDKKVSKLEGAS